jgi:N-acetyl-anhydromuramyl-L-alanine amidase AmpD
MSERAYPHVNVRRVSPNYSSRAGARPTLIVIHVTAGHNRPGIADLAGLGSWFASPSAQVSSHVATDNEGHSARFVGDALKAWHVAAYNRMALGIEQVAPGSGAEITDAMYRETARWVATWSRSHGIPIQHAAVAGGRVIRPGVIRHSELGSLGGGHSDPGPYDIAKMLDYARRYRKMQAA